MAKTTPKNLLVDYSYPLSQVTKSANPDIDLRTNDRVWYSQPRTSVSPDWEILTIGFRKPVMVTDLSFDLLKKYQQYEFNYTNTKGVTNPFTDEEGNAIAGTIYGGEETAVSAPAHWQNITKRLNAVVVTKVELRMRRLVDPTNFSGLFSLGARNILLKRTVYTQQDTLYSIDSDTDFLGNSVRKEVKDWRPELAIDNSPFSFWKSGPQPDPNAVVNLYTSMYSPTGDPVRIDRMYIDPVYTGSSMNMYYSTDPTYGVLRPKPQAAPVYGTSTNVPGRGLDLTTTSVYKTVETSKLVYNQGESENTGNNTVGEGGGWIGGEFEVGPNQTGTKYIFSSNNENGSKPLFLTYNYSTKIFDFTVGYDGYEASLISNPVDLPVGALVQFVAAIDRRHDGGMYDVTNLFISVSGVLVSDTFGLHASNPDPASDISPVKKGFNPLFYDTGNLSFNSGIGYMRSFILKVRPTGSFEHMNFMNDPDSYIMPGNLGKTNNNTTPNHNLDNALYVGNFLSGGFGFGGAGEELYTEKVWTPVWKDWNVQTGFYYLPDPILANHIKLEFTNLTEQPYPIYETGIQVPYQTFPADSTLTSRTNFTDQTSVSHSSVLGANANVSVSNNGQNTSGNLVPKISVFTFAPVVDGIRNQNLYSPSILGSEKIGTDSIKGSATNDVRMLAAAIVRQMSSPNSVVGENLSAPSNVQDVANAGLIGAPIEIDTNRPSQILGSRMPGWWVLPGGKLKLPEEMMTNMVKSSSVIERTVSSSETTTLRTRFPAVSVHRYDQQVATRDVGLAYFAGVRDLKFFITDPTVYTDADQYKVLSWYENNSTKTGATVAGRNNDNPTAGIGSITSYTFNSIATFVKIQMETLDRGLQSDTKGSDLVQYGLSGGATWADTVAKWADNTATWGSSTNLIGIDFTSDITYSGKEAIRIHRGASVGVTGAGASTRNFNCVQHSRMRLCLNIFRPTTTTNSIKIQLEKVGGAVLQEFTAVVPPGVWTEFKSPFFHVPTAQTDLRINILVNGNQDETVYVSDLYDESTSIVYYLSNDNGVNYYEVTEILDGPGKFFQFPSPGNQLKVKMEIWASYDYAYGYTITPSYLY